MLIVWLAQGRPHYPSMERGSVAYISDIGAYQLKPLFVAGCSVTAAFFFLSLLSFRANHRLGLCESIFDLLSLVFGTMGAVSLILLSVFDTHRHSSLHRLFLFLFMLGIILSAIFTTLEYRRLGRTHRERKVLKYSYQAKRLVFITEFLLSIAFGVTMYKKKQNPAAILEWVIAFIFTIYVLTFFFDLRPSAGTRFVGNSSDDSNETSQENLDGMERGNGYIDGNMGSGQYYSRTPVAPVQMHTTEHNYGYRA